VVSCQSRLAKNAETTRLWVEGHPRSSFMAQIERPYATSY